MVPVQAIALVPSEAIALSAVLNYGTIPPGALLGGLLAATLGLDTALWITTAMVPLASLFLSTSPLRKTRELPTGAPAWPTHPPLAIDTPHDRFVAD